MWFYIFLWALFSSIFVHVVAAVIAFVRMRKHKSGRFIPVVILVAGILSPVTGGAVTSKYNKHLSQYIFVSLVCFFKLLQ